MPLRSFVSGGWGFNVDTAEDYLHSEYPLHCFHRKHKICVHITYWHSDNRIDFLRRQLVAFNDIDEDVDVFIHTNVERLPFNLRHNIVFHDMSADYCHFLSWKHRPLMESHLKYYDFFIYSEDDLLFTKQSWEYYIKHHGIVRRHNSYIGFVRAETDGTDWYSTDISPIFVSDCKLPTKEIDGYTYQINNNNIYNGMWILDNVEMQKFVKHESWDLRKCTFFGNFIREKPAIGPIPFYKEVLLDLSHPGSIIHHMPNNYLGHSVFCQAKLEALR